MAISSFSTFSSLEIFGSLELCRQSQIHAKLLLLPSSFQMLSTIKSTFLLSSLLERPLCCLAFITLIHCSVFKVQSLSFVKVRIKYSSLLNTYFRAYLRLVGPSGLEPPTLRLSVVRSSQLSYGPLFSLVEIVGIEPATSCLQGRRSPS